MNRAQYAGDSPDREAGRSNVRQRTDIHPRRQACFRITPQIPTLFAGLLLVGGTAMLGTILLVVLVLMLIGSVPTWRHIRSWGYGPSGGLGLVVLILVVLLLTGNL